MSLDRRSRILVVDDSSTIRTSLGQLLQDDFEVLFANDGKEGWAQALQALPDAIVSDLEMPILDGVQLLRALKEDPRTEAIPVIIATTSTEVSRVNECRALGCAGFVLKPIQKEYLIAKLRSLLRTRKAS